MTIVSGRFTPYDDQEFIQFVEFMTRLCCQSCLIIKHDADDEVSRTHCHFVLEFTKSASRWLQLFHEYFNKIHNTETNYYKGNSNISKKEIKKDEMDKALWYICKYDKPQVLLKVGYTENDIETFHQESENYVNALKKQNQNYKNSEKEYKDKVKPLTFPQICAKELLVRYPKTSEYANWNFGWKDDRLRVYNLVCDMLGKNGKVLDDIIIHRLMCGVMMIVEPESCKQLFRKKVMDKFDAEFD